MRKLFAVVIVVLLSLTFCFAFAACDTAVGDGDTKYDDEIADLQDQLDELKNSLSDTQDALDTANTEIANLQNYFAAGGKIYGVGETATIYSNGIKLFEITYMGHDAYSLLFSAKNLTNANLLLQEVIYAKLVESDSTFTTYNNFLSSAVMLPNVPRTFSDIPNRDNVEYVYLGFPSSTYGVIPYAIFKV